MRKAIFEKYHKFLIDLSNSQLPEPLSQICKYRRIDRAIIPAMLSLNYVRNSISWGHYIWNHGVIGRPTRHDVENLVSRIETMRYGKQQKQSNVNQPQLQLKSTSGLKADIEAEIVWRIKHLERISGWKYKLTKIETITTIKSTVIYE